MTKNFFSLNKTRTKTKTFWVNSSKLLTILQMSASPIRVFIRARPTNNFASNNIKIDESKGEITINIPKDASRGIINHQQENWQFNFDKILLNTSQEVVFNLTAKDIISGALEGYSGTVIAYG